MGRLLQPDAGARQPAIAARGLAKRFGQTVALAAVDLDVEPGSIVGLLGPNGSGKSTFLRVLVGLVRPDAGTAVVAGARLAGDGVAVRARSTFAPGEIAFYGELRAREQIAFLLRGRERGALSRALAAARDLSLPLEARMRSYSHGMKRQLLFSAALAPDVPVRILDEPSEGLDPTKRGTMLAMLRDDAARGRAILLSSHHLGEVDRACDRLVFLAGGRKIADETAAGVAARARTLVRLTYASDAQAETVARSLATMHAGVRAEGARVLVRLTSDDPRTLLGEIAAARTLPAPSAVEFGQLSLAELYRELYGVEGC